LAAEDPVPYLVVFGAAVRADGSPSGSLRRRTEGAAALAEHLGGGRFVVTGGVGRHGPAEAEVMRDILVALGVELSRIELESQANDTLSSIYHCKVILDGREDVGQVIVCSSPYHNPRCAVLFRLVGIRAGIGDMPSDRPHLGLTKWLYYVAREIPATAWDIVLVLFARLRGRPETKPHTI
jgi:uncharacterized SAM-binding protein YcdF (DUF218 family)